MLEELSCPCRLDLRAINVVQDKQQNLSLTLDLKILHNQYTQLDGSSLSAPATS